MSRTVHRIAALAACAPIPLAALLALACIGYAMGPFVYDIDAGIGWRWSVVWDTTLIMWAIAGSLGVLYGLGVLAVVLFDKASEVSR